MPIPVQEGQTRQHRSTASGGIMVSAYLQEKNVAERT